MHITKGFSKNLNIKIEYIKYTHTYISHYERQLAEKWVRIRNR